MSEYRYFQLHTEGDVCIVRLVNPELLDRLLIDEVGDDLIRYIEQQKPRQLLVNFDQVTFCSSEVMGSLIRVHKRMVINGGDMKLCSMKEEIHELFRITNLEGTVFEIYDSEAEALAAFGG